jgi:hypothetical protein
MLLKGASIGSGIYTLCRYICIYRGDVLPKPLKSFRFNPQIYDAFRQLSSRNGYTVTAALEKFMETALQHGLVFPSPTKIEDAEAEARILLTWLKQGQYWYYLTEEESISTAGRLLQLLPKIRGADLKVEIEEALKKKS